MFRDTSICGSCSPDSGDERQSRYDLHFTAHHHSKLLPIHTVKIVAGPYNQVLPRFRAVEPAKIVDLPAQSLRDQSTTVFDSWHYFSRRF